MSLMIDGDGGGGSYQYPMMMIQWGMIQVEDLVTTSAGHRVELLLLLAAFLHVVVSSCRW